MVATGCFCAPMAFWNRTIRITLKTDDAAFIYVHYAGMRHGPSEVMKRLARGESVDPSEYYFRVAPMFETGILALRLAKRDIGDRGGGETAPKRCSLLDLRDPLASRKSSYFQVAGKQGAVASGPRTFMSPHEAAGTPTAPVF